LLLSPSPPTEIAFRITIIGNGIQRGSDMAVFATKRTDASLLVRQLNASGRLGLAAAPVLALMSGITAINAPGMTICTTAAPLAPINEMALMYLLMSIFHLSPWLKLFSAYSRRQTEGD
jgi:hypothetical protein